MSPGKSSESQLKLRADRLGLNSPDLLVATETCLESILKMVEEVAPGSWPWTPSRPCTPPRSRPRPAP